MLLLSYCEKAWKSPYCCWSLLLTQPSMAPLFQSASAQLWAWHMSCDGASGAGCASMVTPPSKTKWLLPSAPGNVANTESKVWFSRTMITR